MNRVKENHDLATNHRIMLIILIAASVLSAFAIIYSQDKYRRLLIDKQRDEAEHSALQIEHGKRLLEQGVLTSEARIEQLASQLLHMHVPTSDDIVLIPLRSHR